MIKEIISSIKENKGEIIQVIVGGVVLGVAGSVCLKAAYVVGYARGGLDILGEIIEHQGPCR